MGEAKKIEKWILGVEEARADAEENKRILPVDTQVMAGWEDGLGPYAFFFALSEDWVGAQYDLHEAPALRQWI
jgi:hypothetical protein